MRKKVMILMTDSYAGNFEREAVAYCTGCIGECGVGEEYANDDLAETFDPYLIHQVDDSGCTTSFYL